MRQSSASAPLGKEQLIMKEQAHRDEDVVTEVIAVILAIVFIIVLLSKFGDWLGVFAS